MVTVVQLVRASDCGSECRGFESHQSPSSHPSQLRVVRDFLFSRSPPAFLLFLSFVDSPLRHNAPPATRCRCVSLRSCRVLGFLPLLLSPSCPGCSVVVLFFGAAYECAHERRARVGDIGVNLSARSLERVVSRQKRAACRAIVGSASSSGLAFSAGERDCGSRAYIHARVRRFSFFAFIPSPCGTLGWLLIV